MTTTVYIPTLTFATKAGKLLSRANIKSKLIKTVSEDDEGCRYALLISSADIYDAVFILKDASIPYRITAK